MSKPTPPRHLSTLPFPRPNPADPAAAFGASNEAPLSTEAIEHGQRQVRQMLKDRPVMEQYGSEARELYEWATHMFARKDMRQKVFWNASEPPSHTNAMSRACAAREPGCIQVSSQSNDGPRKGKDKSFEDLWCHTVFELYNVGNGKDFRRLISQAAAGELTKSEFVAKCIDSESRAAESTRAFYIRVFLPWAKAHHVPTHPTSWFVGCRLDPSDALLHARSFENTSYHQYYEQYYDSIVLRSLIVEGKYVDARDLAEKMCAYALDKDEKVAIGVRLGYCQLQLNEPTAAIGAYNRVIELDPTNSHAYLGRAVAYVVLGDVDRAIADSSAAIQLQPLDAAVYAFRAKMYTRAGDNERAQADAAIAEELSELSKLRGEDAVHPAPAK